MFEQPQPSRSKLEARRVLIGVGILALLLLSGWLYTKYVPPELAYRHLRDDIYYAYNFEQFVADHPNSHRINDVDDLMFQHVTLQFDDTERWRLYRRLFPAGRHIVELDKQISDRKQSELAALRSHMEPQRAALFMEWFYDTPEGVVVHDLLLDYLEKNGAGSQLSPSVPVFRRLLQSAVNDEITFTFTGYTYESAIPRRLEKAFQEFGIRMRQGETGLIRINTERIEDNENSLTAEDGLKVPSLIVRSEVSIYLPGETKSAWTHTFEARTPNRVSFTQQRDSKDTGNFTVAVADATEREMEGIVGGLFRYWWPEPELRFWSSLQEFRRWYGNSNASPAEALERLNALPMGDVHDTTLLHIHTLIKDMFEWQVAPKNDPAEASGVSIQPLIRTVEFGMEMERYLPVAEAKFGK